jgi:hypothetical protein
MQDYSSRLPPLLAAGTFEKTSWGWQFQQLSQRFGEWLERLLSQNQPSSSTSFPAIPDLLLKVLFWAMVIGAIVWTSWQLYRFLSPYLANYWQLRQANPAPSLQVPARRSMAEWLEQARAAQRQGNYREACVALYRATLQQLNDRGLIAQEASRTDGEYLSLLQVQNLPQPYRILIQTHERLCFDRVTASAEICDRCWQAYQDIERL